MSTLYVDNLEPNLGSRVMAAGHVVQVVQDSAPNSGSPVYTSTSFTDIGLSVSITPTSATSKFLCIYTCPVFYYVPSGSLTAIGGGFRLYRDTTVIDDTQGDSAGALGQWMNLNAVNPQGYWDFFQTHTGNFLDSPATTSTIDYNVKLSVRQGYGRLGYDAVHYGPKCRLTVMEIAQ